MDERVKAVLADYERRAAEEEKIIAAASPDEFAKRINDFLLPVGPATGTMLHLLATGARANTILEIGTSYGYSTVWLADAARANRGRVHTVELSEKKVAYAREQLQRAGLATCVEFHIGSALDILPSLAGPFDFVLVDLWKDLYTRCLELIHPKLAHGALIAADNMLHPPSARAHAEAYQKLVRTKGDLDSVLLPIGSGVELSRKR
jgi:predicted O-methyltransferase YrrM